MKIGKLTLRLLLVGVCLLGACKNNSVKEEQTQQVEIASVESLMPERVQTVFNRSCVSCHGHDGHGITGIAPDLRRAAKRKADDWLKYFSNSKGPHPGSTTPLTMWKSRDEIVEVAKFLSHETDPPAEAETTR